MMRDPGDMQTVWYTLMLGGRGEEVSVSLPIRIDADDEKPDAGELPFCRGSSTHVGTRLYCG